VALVTIIEVAKHAMVSPAIVSRLLNGDETLRVSPETRVRVLKSVEELKYVPSYAARSLRMNIPSVISLLLPDTTSTLNANLLKGVEDGARTKDLGVNILRAEILEEGMDRVLKFIREGRTDGILLQIPDSIPDSIYGELEELSIPLVILNSVSEGALPTVVLDDDAAIRIAHDYLTSCGHVNIGFVGGLPSHYPAKRRAESFRSITNLKGLQSPGEWFTELGLTNEDGAKAADYFFALANRPTAVIVANVNAAMGFIAQAHRLGKSLPSDLSIIAIHDVPYAESTWPPLTTIAMPFYELGRRGVEMLFAGKGEVEHVSISDPAPELHVRESVAKLN
jgi:LacI family transcriptional regulator